MIARDVGHAIIAILFPAIIVFFVIAPRAALAAASDQVLLLAVVVNGHATDKIGQFVLRGGSLFARREELRDLGFRIPDAITATDQDLIALSDLSDFSHRLDQPTQTLYVTASPRWLTPTLLGAGAATTSSPAIESGLGTTLNYDVVGTSSRNQQLGSGMFDARAFSPWGVLSSGLLAYAGAPAGSTSNTYPIRLDTTYVYSDPGTMRRYRAGDFISGFLSWTRPVRLGGAQINSDFSMRPDLITFPVPAVAGSVAVPSTVDVLVNGSRVLSSQVQPGPFQVPQLPIITGAGTVATTVTNALGQQVTTELPFYAAPTLLSPGLQTYSGELGATRRNWGIVSDDYGYAAGAATYRRGMTDALTVESHIEGSRALFMGGAGVIMNLYNLAVGNVAVAGSGGDSHTGAQLAIGAQRTDRRLSLGASAIVATHNFGDIAAANGDPAPQLQLNANVGLSLGQYGSIGVAYVGFKRPEAPSPVQVFVPPGTIATQGTSLQASTTLIQPVQRSRLVSASYSVQVYNTSLFATAFRDFAQKSSGVYIGMTVPFGSRASATASVQSQSGTQTVQGELMQSADTVGEWGYRLLGAANNPNHEFAEASYKSPWGLVTGGVDRLDHLTTAQGDVRGALSVVDGGVFASNWIDDSFAIADTNGVEGIRVRQDNRVAGVTGSSGKLLVPDLRSFQDNKVSIDAIDAPADVSVPFAQQQVRPQDRSGVVVNFPLKRSNGVLLRLQDDAGKPIQIGSTATLVSTGVAVPVGYDGEAYVIDLQPHNDVLVERADGAHCTVSFDYHAVPGEIPTIGPLPCREARP